MSLSSFCVRASWLGAAALLCGLLAALPARAADKDLLTLGVGAFDFVSGENDTIAASLEYLSARKLWIFSPFAGVMGTLDSSVYGYGGLAVDLKLTDHWVLTPSIAAGIYVRGDGRDLGAPLEVRSAVQLGYAFDNGVRAGLLFYHLSNAGLSEQNPGTEVLMATYGIPLGR